MGTYAAPATTTYTTSDAAPTMTYAAPPAMTYAAPTTTTYATSDAAPTMTMFTAPTAQTYSPAAVMMPGTATMAPMTTTVLPSSQFVGLPNAQSMVAYPSYPGMLPQAYMPSISAGMVAPTMAGIATGTAPALTEGTSAVPNVGQPAAMATTKLGSKKKKISGDK